MTAPFQRLDLPVLTVASWLLVSSENCCFLQVRGALLPIPCNLEAYDANLVALPIERTEEFLSLLGQKYGEISKIPSLEPERKNFFAHVASALVGT